MGHGSWEEAKALIRCTLKESYPGKRLPIQPGPTVAKGGTHAFGPSRKSPCDPRATPGPMPEHACRLISGTFAIFVQGALAISAIGTLVYKRSTERPRRPWIVWFFDASKQAFAGGLQHMVNLAFGILFATTGQASECAWYMTNFTISVACGVIILWGFMAAYKWVVDRYHLTLLRTGEYGSPPSWRPWLAQMLIWGFFSCFEKFLTAVFVIVPLHQHLDSFATWLEAPFITYPATELVFVMVIAPIVLNMVFFWVVDNLIMRKRHVGGPEGGGADDRPHDDKQPLLEEDPSICSGCIPPFSPTRGPSSSDYVAPTLNTATRRGVNGQPSAAGGGASCSDAL